MGSPCHSRGVLTDGRRHSSERPNQRYFDGHCITVLTSVHAWQEPTVLPARVPQLLVNGSQGIAVGMATNIPPHNLSEAVAGLQALIADPDISLHALMAHIPAPDFPTGSHFSILCLSSLPLSEIRRMIAPVWTVCYIFQHLAACVPVRNASMCDLQPSTLRGIMLPLRAGGIIVATGGIREAYETGRGPITIRGCATIENENAGLFCLSCLCAICRRLVVLMTQII